MTDAPGASNRARSPRVAVTGANGYVGSHVVRTLRGAGVEVRAVVRHLPNIASDSRDEGEGTSSTVAIGDIAGEVDRDEALDGVDVIAYLGGQGCAAGDAPVPAERHDAINRRATERLASAASLAGVERFVFLSSATVYGGRGGRQREHARGDAARTTFEGLVEAGASFAFGGEGPGLRMERGAVLV